MFKKDLLFQKMEQYDEKIDINQKEALSKGLQCK